MSWSKETHPQQDARRFPGVLALCCMLSGLVAAACGEDGGAATGTLPDGVGAWPTPQAGTGGWLDPADPTNQPPVAGHDGSSQLPPLEDPPQDDDFQRDPQDDTTGPDQVDTTGPDQDDTSLPDQDDTTGPDQDDTTFPDDTTPPDTTANSCLEGITNYTRSGPFRYTSRSHGRVNVWVPQVPSGCKVPVVHLANGTGARCSTYRGTLEHLASHGFLATCYEDTNTGQGQQCVDAIATVMERYPELADSKIGSTGHSQGGSGAIMCVYRAEQRWGDAMIYAGHAQQPAHGYGDAPSNYSTYYRQIKSPQFMFNGSRDSLVSASWVRRGFDALDANVEAYFYEAVGAPHIPVPTRWTNQSAVPWFRWKLLGDREACRYFKDLPSTSDWRRQRDRNATDC